MKKIVVCITILLSMSSMMVSQSFQENVKQLAIKLQPYYKADNQKPSLAIYRFSTENNAYAFEQYFSDTLFECLFSIGVTRLIEREQIKKVIEEQSFQVSGNVDDDTVKGIGKIIGVDYICYGTITKLGKDIRITGRTVDVQTGEIIAFGSIEIAPTDEIEMLFNPSYKGQIALGSKGYSGIQAKNWTIKAYRNDFKDSTIITLTCVGSGSDFIVMGYEKNDSSLRSKIVLGVSSPNCSGDTNIGRIYDIKEDSRKISSLTLWGRTWSETTGSEKSPQGIRLFSENNKKRFFFDLLINNNLLVFKNEETIIKYDVSGLSKILSDNGITYKEISGVLSNEEF